MDDGFGKVNGSEMVGKGRVVRVRREEIMVGYEDCEARIHSAGGI